jgi:alginate O-acetyltransferase complex protein AlgI
MLASIAVNYLTGLCLHAVRDKKTLIRRLVLASGITLNLGILFWYKYLAFAVDIFNSVFNVSLPLKNVALPIGISFFTFQGMTYVIDLYRNNVNVQKNPFKVALYISLFPQLIAGPIVRYKDIAAQIESRSITLDNFHLGVTRFIAGLGKKVIIANNAAIIADSVFNAPPYSHASTTAWLGVICYAFQIYFDFSGYSDMAIGLGHMFGFEFLENFNYPYISSSVREFWQRWHISLSTFFRDYLYIPLGGNRSGNVYMNLLVVFIATGLWHGASMNFVLWGLWHGFFIALEKYLNKARSASIDRRGIVTVLKHCYTLSVVLIGWVLFRAENITQAGQYIKTMFGFGEADVKVSTLFYINPFVIIILSMALIFSTPVAPVFKAKLFDKFHRQSLTLGLLHTALLCLVFLVSGIMIINSNYNPFIYFRF